jgi:hypothetical protein
MAIMIGCSILLKYTWLAKSYIFDPWFQFLLKTFKVPFFGNRFTPFEEIGGRDIFI